MEIKEEATTISKTYTVEIKEGDIGDVTFSITWCKDGTVLEIDNDNVVNYANRSEIEYWRVTALIIDKARDDSPDPGNVDL